MKFLILFACVASLHVMTSGQALNCQTSLAACETAYTQSLPNDQGSKSIYCQITNVMVQCVEALASRTECTNNMVDINRLRKKSQESLSVHNCPGTGAATQCQANLDTCQRSLVSDIAVAGHNSAAQCNAANKFVNCLNAKVNDPSCAGKKADIDSLRKKYEDSFNNAGCGADANSPRENCNADVKECEDRFINGVTKSGNDVSAACIAGSTLETCLKGREGLDECKDAKSTIDTVRQTYKQQIDADGCGSSQAMECAQSIQDCTATYNTGIPTMTTPDSQCKGANTYIDCLNAVHCSSAYKGQFNQALTMVQGMVKGTSCTLKTLTAHGGASRNVPIVATVLSVLVALCFL